ncbi:hypothetical protein ACFLQI_03560 [Candidatus Undinarchaeota archaeon]
MSIVDTLTSILGKFFDFLKGVGLKPPTKESGSPWADAMSNWVSERHMTKRKAIEAEVDKAKIAADAAKDEGGVGKEAEEKDQELEEETGEEAETEGDLAEAQEKAAIAAEEILEKSEAIEKMTDAVFDRMQDIVGDFKQQIENAESAEQVNIALTAFLDTFLVVFIQEMEKFQGDDEGIKKQADEIEKVVEFLKANLKSEEKLLEKLKGIEDKHKKTLDQLKGIEEKQKSRFDRLFESRLETLKESVSNAKDIGSKAKAEASAVEKLGGSKSVGPQTDQLVNTTNQNLSQEQVFVKEIHSKAGQYVETLNTWRAHIEDTLPQTTEMIEQVKKVEEKEEGFINKLQEKANKFEEAPKRIDEIIEKMDKELLDGQAKAKDLEAVKELVKRLLHKRGGIEKNVRISVQITEYVSDFYDAIRDLLIVLRDMADKDYPEYLGGLEEEVTRTVQLVDTSWRVEKIQSLHAKGWKIVNRVVQTSLEGCKGIGKLNKNMQDSSEEMKKTKGGNEAFENFMGDQWGELENEFEIAESSFKDNLGELKGTLELIAKEKAKADEFATELEESVKDCENARHTVIESFHKEAIRPALQKHDEQEDKTAKYLDNFEKQLGEADKKVNEKWKQGKLRKRHADFDKLQHNRHQRKETRKHLWKAHKTGKMARKAGTEAKVEEVQDAVVKEFAAL